MARHPEVASAVAVGAYGAAQVASAAGEVPYFVAMPGRLAAPGAANADAAGVHTADAAFGRHIRPARAEDRFKWQKAQMEDFVFVACTWSRLRLRLSLS